MKLVDVLASEFWSGSQLRYNDMYSYTCYFVYNYGIIGAGNKIVSDRLSRAFCEL